MKRSARRAHVALLRGINVGGKNVLPMRELAALFVDLGATDVSTYIQSGNVIFAAAAGAGARIGARAKERIAESFGLDVPVIVRTADDLARVVAGNPLVADGADVESLHVMFLEHEPDESAIAALDPARSPPDRFVVLGREIYLSCPNGVAKTKLTNAWFDGKLATTSTGRNWRTVQKLEALARGLGGAG